MNRSNRELFDLETLRKKAWEFLKKSYSPYSTFQVGAALLTDQGHIFGGCNIENASFGATVCAERVALWNWISQGRRGKIKSIYITTSAVQAWAPCGLCRQVLIEFCSSNTLVTYEGKNQIQKTTTLSDLLPEAFGPQQLKKKLSQKPKKKKG